MLSSNAIQDFAAACESVRYDAERATHQACMTAGNQAQPGHSRRNVLMDEAAAATFESHARAVHALLDQLNAADPPTDVPARRQQLGDLIEDQLRNLGDIVEGALRQHVGLAMMALTNPFLPAQLNGSVNSAIRKYRGQLGLSVSSAGNVRGQTTVQNINVTNHGSIANLQTGHAASATVAQSVVSQVSPGEVKAALNALIKALDHAQGIAPAQRAEVAEVLEQLKAEADKEKPNRITVGSLVGGVRDVLEGLQAAPEAWKTVKDWYTVIAGSAVQAAPAIGQALQNLGS